MFAGDGHLLDSKRVGRGLLESLFRNLKSAGKSEFEKLIGWSEFIASEECPTELAGLVVEGDDLVFRFSSPPELLLNYLRMPYFGIWLAKPSRDVSEGFGFSSTGSYQLLGESDGRSITLIARNTPFLSSDSPKLVRIEFTAETDVINTEPMKKTIVNCARRRLVTASIKEHYHTFSSPPDGIFSFILNPNSLFFQDVDDRRLFGRDLRRALAKVDLNQIGLLPARGFYPDSSLPPIEPRALSYSKSSRPVRVALGKMSAQGAYAQLYGSLFGRLFSDRGVRYEIVEPDTDDPNWYRQIIDDPEIDLRIGGVNAGNRYDRSVVKMMFCSRIGVRYPDPSGRMAELVERDIEQELAAEEFSRILAEDAAVHPLYFGSTHFLVSKDIQLSTVPKSFTYPRFEDVRVL